MARILNTADYTEAQMRALPVHEREQLYNGLDVCVTLEVLNAIQLSNSAAATYEFNRAMQGPVLEMSLRGLLIDQERKRRVLTDFKRDMSTIEQQLNRLLAEGLGVQLNWKSPAQLKELFYKVLGLKEVKQRNANGQWTATVDREALEKLSFHFYAEPFCNRILALRDLGKKCEFLATAIDSDGRMRSTFNIAGTDTGRLASSESELGTGRNQQNVDRKLRSVFIPTPGYKYANFDLEQADARNVGALCWHLFYERYGAAKAGAYLDACESGDLHTTVCKMAWHDLPWVGDRAGDRAVADAIAYRDLSYRDMAKKLGHGTNYLGTPPTMAMHTKVAVGIIKDFQNRYFAGFPCIKAWQDWTIEEIKESGKLTTLFGDTRTFWGRADDASTHRAAIAHTPQSMTAKQINMALLRAFRADDPILAKLRKHYGLLVQVHDSILLEYREEVEAELIPELLRILPVKLPLVGGREFVVPVECKVGWNWGDVEYNRDGSVKANPHGLVKWKGSDARSKPERITIKDLF